MRFDMRMYYLQGLNTASIIGLLMGFALVGVTFENNAQQLRGSSIPHFSPRPLGSPSQSPNPFRSPLSTPPPVPHPHVYHYAYLCIGRIRD